MTDNRELVLLFSGGIDSTYTAILMTKGYKKIRLITYDRYGFINTENSRSAVRLLKDKFSESKFSHEIINIDWFFKMVSYQNYIQGLLKYKFFVLLTCGLCKLAMHWRTIIYCIDNNIKFVCDGSNQEMIDPSQDKEVIGKMQELYNEFGIKYFNPVFSTSKQIREKIVFDLGLSPVQHTKKTRFSWERQPFCNQEYLFLKLYNYACSGWDTENIQEISKRQLKYRQNMLAYHSHKRSFIKQQIYKYLSTRCLD